LILAVAGQLLFKLGMTRVGKVYVSQFLSKIRFIIFNPYIILGMFLYVVSAGVWLTILSRIDLSFAYPMLSLSYVSVVFFSGILLKEKISWVRWAGVAIICAGVFLIARS
jgi:drug/metabolite transporter (DMT)-like permease